MPLRSTKSGFSASLTLLIVGAALLVPPPASGQQSKPQKPPKPIPGGANQVEGLNGKVGQMLFTGKWRFQVQSVKEVSTYTLKVASSEQDYGKYSTYADVDSTLKTFTPKAGYTLFAVECLAKNAQKKVQQLDFYLNDQKTALADKEGNSYPPIVFDMQSKGAWMTKPLLPGSEVKMTVLFAAPPETKLKDVIFTLKNWEDSKGKEVRVSLPQPAPAATPAAAP